MTRPDVIAGIHAAYLDAGADLVETNTFNATAVSQADYHLEHLVYALNRAGADMARRCCDAQQARTPDTPRFVIGVPGPTSRTAPGDPACPEHSEKRSLSAMLGAEGIGMSLTENFAMLPTAAVSGYYFSHPQSQYFVVGRVSREQAADYARRTGVDRAQAENGWLRTSTTTRNENHSGAPTTGRAAARCTNRRLVPPRRGCHAGPRFRVKAAAGASSRPRALQMAGVPRGAVGQQRGCGPE